jgi:hypothetical protein
MDALYQLSYVGAESRILATAALLVGGPTLRWHPKRRQL